MKSTKIDRQIQPPTSGTRNRKSARVAYPGLAAEIEFLENMGIEVLVGYGQGRPERQYQPIGYSEDGRKVNAVAWKNRGDASPLLVLDGIWNRSYRSALGTLDIAYQAFLTGIPDGDMFEIVDVSDDEYEAVIAHQAAVAFGCDFTRASDTALAASLGELITTGLADIESGLSS